MALRKPAGLSAASAWMAVKILACSPGVSSPPPDPVDPPPTAALQSQASAAAPETEAPAAPAPRTTHRRRARSGGAFEARAAGLCSVCSRAGQACRDHAGARSDGVSRHLRRAASRSRARQAHLSTRATDVDRRFSPVRRALARFQGDELRAQRRLQSTGPQGVLCRHLRRGPLPLPVGDVRWGSVKRLASAAGEGSMAVVGIHEYLARTKADRSSRLSSELQEQAVMTACFGNVERNPTPGNTLLPMVHRVLVLSLAGVLVTLGCSSEDSANGPAAGTAGVTSGGAATAGSAGATSGSGGGGAPSSSGAGGAATLAGSGGAAGNAGAGGTGGGAGNAGGGGGGSGGGAGSGGSGGGPAEYNPCPTNGDPCRVMPLGIPDRLSSDRA